MGDINCINFSHQLFSVLTYIGINFCLVGEQICLLLFSFNISVWDALVVKVCSKIMMCISVGAPCLHS